MKKLFFALPFLLAGCQAERVAFQFQPVAPTVGTAPARRVAQSAPALGTAPSPFVGAQPTTSNPAASPGSATGIPGPNLPAKVAGRRARQVAPLAAGTAMLAAPATGARVVPRLLASQLALRPLGRRQRATAGPARATENGLGGIALFFIAVVLGVLAGLGALVSLIFGTGFFTGVGFAAAGLVVLFLLYSLLSGGKKKSKPTK